MINKIIAYALLLASMVMPCVTRAREITTLSGLTQKPVTVALNRVQSLTGMNPQSVWQNAEERWVRLGLGAYWWTTLCGASSTCPGSFSDLSIYPVTGLTVAVGPTVTGTVGQLYQFLPEETTAMGGYPSGVGTYLPADTTPVVLQGTLQTNTPSITMIAGSASGQSVNNLIECAVYTYDTNSSTINIVSSGGSVTSTQANRDRDDGIECQDKPGTSATTGSQTTPGVDSGWTAVGVVSVAYGATSIATSNIAASTPFRGFAQASAYGSNAVVLSPSAQQSGSLNINGAGTFGGGVTVGALTSGAISGTTGSFTGAGTFGGGVSVTGNSTFGGTVAVSGNITANNGIVPIMYSATGSPIASGGLPHVVIGECTTTAGTNDGCSYVLTGAAAFTGGATWTCATTTVASSLIPTTSFITLGGAGFTVVYADQVSRTGEINWACTGY